MNNNKNNLENKIEKNLKRGYIFLIFFILIPFIVAFTFEIYREGGFKFKVKQTPLSYPISFTGGLINTGKPKLELQNLKDGLTTKDSSISVVALTEVGNTAVINNDKVNVDDAGHFEKKIDLIVGQNQVSLSVKDSNGNESTLNIFITREEQIQPAPKAISTPAPQTIVKNNPTPVLQPTPSPAPNSTPLPTQSSITALKINCSVTNTHPSVGQSVSVNCKVIDQNGNGISGAFGYVTLGWKTRNSVYTLSQSDSSGNMSVSFNVPAGNSGGITGSVQIAKGGLNVNSNFNLTVQ